MIILDCIHRSYSITPHLIIKIIPKSIPLYLYLYNFSSLIFDFFLFLTPSLLFLNNMESSYVSSPTYPFIPFYQFFVKYQYTVFLCIISSRLFSYLQSSLKYSTTVHVTQILFVLYCAYIPLCFQTFLYVVRFFDSRGI